MTGNYRRMKNYAKVRLGCIFTMILTFVVMCTYAFGMHMVDAKNIGFIEPFPGKENIVDVKTNVETIERNITVVITSVETEEATLVEATETEEVEVVEEIKLFPEEKLDLDVQRHMYKMCQKYDIPMEIMMALAFKESSYNSLAEGVDGKDHGLCQIRTNNHQWIRDVLGRYVDFFDPYENIEAACLMLSNIRNRNQDKGWQYILLCYNRGETGAKKYVARYGTSSSSYTHSILTKARELGYRG